MIPTLLITLREVIEASLIVATILGILVKLNQKEHIRIVWTATLAALIVSFLLVFFGSVVGLQIRRVMDSPLTEGFFLTISAFFVTWAVFTLHRRFAREKMHMLTHLNQTIEKNGLFLFTFAAVFREGIEIVLFLSTLYLTNTPYAIMAGFASGVFIGLLISVLFFSATIRLPVYWAFRITSYLLIVFAAGLLAQGVSAFAVAGIFPHIGPITFHMDLLQLSVYLTYIYFMHRRVFVRSR